MNSLREHIGIFDTDIPVRFGENAVNKEVVFIYDLVMENMLTKEEIFTIRCITKFGMEYSQIAVILKCSERTAQRYTERAVKKIRTIVDYLDMNKLSESKNADEMYEKNLRRKKKKRDIPENSLF